MISLHIKLKAMKNFTLLLSLGICLTLFACSKNNDQDNMSELNQIFQLEISETVNFADLDIEVTADRVIEDNRCPSDAICVIAGWVSVLFEFTVEGISYPITLKLDPSNPQEAEAEISGYTIRLVTVNPYPETSNEIDQEDYNFSIVVEQ